MCGGQHYFLAPIYSASITLTTSSTGTEIFRIDNNGGINLFIADKKAPAPVSGDQGYFIGAYKKLAFIVDTYYRLFRLGIALCFRQQQFDRIRIGQCEAIRKNNRMNRMSFSAELCISPCLRLSSA